MRDSQLIFLMQSRIHSQVENRTRKCARWHHLCAALSIANRDNRGVSIEIISSTVDPRRLAESLSGGRSGPGGMGAAVAREPASHLHVYDPSGSLCDALSEGVIQTCEQFVERFHDLYIDRPFVQQWKQCLSNSVMVKSAIFQE